MAKEVNNNGTKGKVKCTNPMPKTRTMGGPQFDTLGYVLKDPRTSSRIFSSQAKIINKKEKLPDMSLKEKQFMASIKLMSNADKKFFNTLTEKRIEKYNEVREADLEQRRNRLKQLLEREKNEFSQEHTMYLQNKYEESCADILKQGQELIDHKKATDEALAVEKYDLLFRQNSVDLRKSISARLQQDATRTQCIQIQQKKLTEKLEKVKDKVFWSQVDAIVMAQQEMAAEKKKQEEIKNQNETNEVLKKQLMGKQMLAEEMRNRKDEEKRIRLKLDEELKREEALRLEKIKQNKQELHKVMYSEMEKSRQRKKQEIEEQKKIDLAYCQFAKDALEKERNLNIDDRVKNKEEANRFCEYNAKLKEIKRQQEAEIEKKRLEVFNKMEDSKKKITDKQLQYSNTLLKEVYETRQHQIFEKQWTKVQEEIQLQTELHNDKLQSAIEHAKEKDQKKESELVRLAYRDFLQNQIAYKKEHKEAEEREEMLRIKCIEEEQQKILKKLEEYKNKPLALLQHPYALHFQ